MEFNEVLIGPITSRLCLVVWSVVVGSPTDPVVTGGGPPGIVFS